jgi:anthranilate/para-aminobenzoate synthase component I
VKRALNSIRTDSSHPDGAMRRAWSRDFRPALVLRADTSGTRLFSSRGIERRWDDPLEALNWMARSKRNWTGFVSYDLGRAFESLPIFSSDDLHLPLFAFGTAEMEVDSPRDWPLGEASFSCTFTRNQYMNAVEQVLEYIRAGDIFQANLSQRFSIGLREQPANIYQRLLTASPAWYGAMLQFPDFAILSNSPELFLHVTNDRRVVTRPIKGTRPREQGMREELLNSAKDIAELNMIVDLHRNDLGRVCEIGSVKVEQARAIEEHPTVYHGVATIAGQLRANVTLVDLLRATFPPGSVTGAPKIRAMQIIDELEPVRRGAYCGAIGHINGDGSMMLSVAIRTMIIKDGLAHVPVGGGIVADSSPAEEYSETLVKARAMLAALSVTHPAE